MCKLLESKGFCFSAQLSSRWSPAVHSPSIMLSFLTFLGFPVDLTFSDGSFIHPAVSLDFQVFLYCRCQVIKVYFDRKTQHFVPSSVASGSRIVKSSPCYNVNRLYSWMPRSFLISVFRLPRSILVLYLVPDDSAWRYHAGSPSPLL